MIKPTGLLLFLAAICASAQGASYFVSPTGDPFGTGTRGNPFPTIAAGIAATTSGDEVVLLEGSYSGAGNQDLEFPAYPITLRGDTTDRYLYVLSPNGGARALFIRTGVQRDAVVKDLTIGPTSVSSLTPALANIQFGGESRVGTSGGGGMIIAGASSPTIQNVFFYQNQYSLAQIAGYDAAGGAVHISANGNPLLLNCEFSLCAVLGSQPFNNGGNWLEPVAYGGAVVIAQASAQIQGCWFDQCVAGGADHVSQLAPATGGALAVREATAPVSISDCKFTSNKAQGGVLPSGGCGPGTNCAGYGGGIYSGSASVIERCIFDQNSSGWSGAIEGYNTTVRRSLFTANQGAGMAARFFSGATVENCSFLNHSGVGDWSLIRVGENSGRFRFTNCTFADNTAAGSSIVLVGPLSPTFLENCTFQDNAVPAAVIYGYATTYSPEINLRGNVFSGSTPYSVWADNSGFGIFSRGGNIFSDGGSLNYFGVGDEVNTDPMLDSGPKDNGGDFTLYDGQHLPTIALLPGSPAIDRDPATSYAYPTTDARGISRAIDGDLDGREGVDSGAFEYIPVPVSPTPTPIPGDFDADGCVGITDFLSLLDNWLVGPNCP